MRVLVPSHPYPWHLIVVSIFNFNLFDRCEVRVHFGSKLHFPSDQ